MKTAEEILYSYNGYEPSINGNGWVDMDCGGDWYNKESVIEAMDEYANQSKWISVEDRLPDEGVEVICCDSKGGNDVSSAYFIQGNFYKIDIDGEPISFEITHWQPLPEKP